MPFRNGLRTRVCKTCAASTKASRLLLRGGKTIRQMNKPAAHSHHLENAFFCVSLNPAIDTRLIVNGFVPGRVNRVREVYRTPGGKAAHVAMALQGLGATPTWIGFSGGATGSERSQSMAELHPILGAPWPHGRPFLRVFDKLLGRD